MNGKEFLEQQTGIIQIGKIIANLNLDPFIEAILRAERLFSCQTTPVFQKAAENLKALKQLTLALQTVKIAHQYAAEAIVRNGNMGFTQGNKGT